MGEHLQHGQMSLMRLVRDEGGARACDWFPEEGVELQVSWMS